ncbi:MAG: hypothetical protein QM767_12150 [Anaeromyxobacter sp.]
MAWPARRFEAGRPARALPWILAAEQIAPEHPGIAVVRAALSLAMQ